MIRLPRNWSASPTPLPILITDSSGTGVASLLYSTSGLVIEYSTNDGLSWGTPITKVAGTLGTYTSGGFIAGTTTGAYWIGLPVAALNASPFRCLVRWTYNGVSRIGEIRADLPAIDTNGGVDIRSIAGNSAAAAGLAGMGTAYNTNGKLSDTAGTTTLLARSDPAITNALRQATDETVLFDRDYFPDLADFTQNDTAFTVSGGRIVVNPGPGANFAKYLELANVPATCCENIDFIIEGTATSVGASSYGLAQGRKAINPNYDTSLTFQFDTSLDAGTNVLQAYQTASGGVPGAIGYAPWTAGANIVNGDRFRMTYQQRGAEVSELVENLTTGLSQRLVLKSTLAANKNFLLPATSKFRLFSLAGQFTISRMCLVSRMPVRPDFAVVADSKGTGYSAGSIAARWAESLKGLGTTAVWAGDGDRTTEALANVPLVLASRPRAILITALTNSIRMGMSTGTWQAEASQIIDAYLASGADVRFLAPIPENSLSDAAQAAWTTYVTAQYPNVPLITLPAFNKGTMVSTDNIHPNATGHAYIGATVKAAYTETPIRSISSRVIDATATALIASTNWANGTRTTTGGTVDEVTNPVETTGGSNVGPGADPTTVRVIIAGNPVADANVWVTSDAQGTITVAGTLQTNSQGKATFLLDSGVTYYLWAQKDGVNAIQGDAFVAE